MTINPEHAITVPGLYHRFPIAGEVTSNEALLTPDGGYLRPEHDLVVGIADCYGPVRLVSEDPDWWDAIAAHALRQRDRLRREQAAGAA